MLRIDPQCLAEIMEDAARSYPEEGCGLLLGRDLGEDRLAQRLFKVENQWEDGSKRRRFKITAEDFLAAETLAAELGLEVIGVYHSHPDHPPAPSAYDLGQAWPHYSYVIAGVEGGRPAGVASWRLAADRSEMAAEPLDASGSAEG
jgi:proteasome lid subunit RPN8/RPN11